jgi:uncharacterized protein
VIVGILSDTHGRVAATKAALAALRDAGAEYFIHCGDVGGEEIFDLMAGMPLSFVWGNTDFEREKLKGYAELLGLKCHGDLAELELGGRRIAVTHGDQAEIVRKIGKEKRQQYLLYGHTHVARDQTMGGLRYVNPGAVHRSPRPSVAVLETRTDTVRFIPVSSSA